MKTYFVKDLSKGLVLNNETFAVKICENLQTKDGKPYYKLVLADKTGEIKAQIWSDNIKNVSKNSLKIGAVMMVDAMVEDYRGVLQLNILKAEKVEENKLNDYMESSDFDLEDLWKDLLKHIDSVKNENIKKFLTDFLNDSEIGPKFKIYPAAEFVHHAFRGGLLEHTVEMLDMTTPLRKYYKEANFDYVVAGIILHDSGKLLELEPVGLVTQRTKEGLLIGHLIKSYELLMQKGKGILNEEQMINLKHIILSHHGYLEFGSPILPSTIEANIVTYVDQMSSKTRIFQKVIRQSQSNDMEFSEYDKIIGAKVYLGTNATQIDTPESHLPFEII